MELGANACRCGQRIPNVIRNKFQLQAKNLNSRACTVLGKADATISEIFECIGMLNGYIETRKQLAPTIAMDRYPELLAGLISRLKKKAAEMMPPN